MFLIVLIYPINAAAIVFWACLLATGVTRAEEKWRILDPPGPLNTSSCIGDPKTPMCAVETAMTCLFTVDQRLCGPDQSEYCPLPPEKRNCGKVGIDTRNLFGNSTIGPPERLRYYRYREIERTRLADMNPTPFERFLVDDRLLYGEPPVRMDDVLLRIRMEVCEPDFVCVKRTEFDPDTPYGEGCRNFRNCRGNPPAIDSIFVLRRKTNGWHYVGEIDMQNFPQGLWKRK